MSNLIGLLLIAILQAGTPALALPVGTSSPTVAVESTAQAPLATVTIRREKKLRDALAKVQITVDGKPVRTIDPGETVTLKLELGERIVGAITQDKMGITSPDIRESAVDLEEGKTYFFRMVLTPGEGFALERASAF